MTPVMLSAITPAFRAANYIEAAVWIVIGLGLAGAAIRFAPARQRLSAAAIVLIAFGVSDIVETQTGAWYHPWWLLVWKGLCVIALVTLLIDHYRRRLRCG